MAKGPTYSKNIMLAAQRHTVNVERAEKAKNRDRQFGIRKRIQAAKRSGTEVAVAAAMINRILDGGRA